METLRNQLSRQVNRSRDAPPWRRSIDGFGDRSSMLHHALQHVGPRALELRQPVSTPCRLLFTERALNDDIPYDTSSQCNWERASAVFSPLLGYYTSTASSPSHLAFLPCGPLLYSHCLPVRGDVYRSHSIPESTCVLRYFE